jgi:hypothetical protein
MTIMRRYFFTIRWPDRHDLDEHGTLLENDAAALDYACAIVRKLLARGGYENPGLVLQVSCEGRQMVHSIPFLAACA